MIPKKIHYFWFGKNPKPSITEYCIQSWRKYLPDYEIIEWNEDNFDITQNNFVKTAYENRKWAFVSDFARAQILYEHGGFYLDTDMEVKNSFNDFLEHSAICGFEVEGIPYSAFWGVEKGHILAKKILDYYLINPYSEIPNTKIFSKLLVEEFGANPMKDEYQELKHGVKLFPSTYFSLDLPINYVTHHFSGSWHDSWTEEENTYKNMVNTYGILHMLQNIPNGKGRIKDVIYNHSRLDIERILRQFPLKFLIKFVLKEMKNKIFNK